MNHATITPLIALFLVGSIDDGPLSVYNLEPPGAVGQAQQTEWRALLDEVDSRRQSLISAAVLYNKEKWYAQSYMLPTRPEDAKKFLEDLAYIEKLMTGRFANIQAPRSYDDRNIMDHPEAWLEIAKARNSIIVKLQGETAATNAAGEVKFIADITAKIRANDGWA